LTNFRLLAYLYIFFTTLTVIFETQYGFRHDLVGLSFLGIGAGQFLGQFLYSWIATRSFNKAQAKGEVEPEQRLGPMMIGAITIPIGLFWYGWAVEFKTQWMNPLVATSVFSLGLLFIFVKYSLSKNNTPYANHKDRCRQIPTWSTYIQSMLHPQWQPILFCAL
jgi:hypothetical protein